MLAILRQGSWLLGLVLGSESEAKGDYTIVVKEIGMKLEFKWTPYEEDLVVSFIRGGTSIHMLCLREVGYGVCFMQQRF